MVYKLNLGEENEQVEFKKSTSELKEAVYSIVAILNKHSVDDVYFGISRFWKKIPL